MIKAIKTIKAPSIKGCIQRRTYGKEDWHVRIICPEGKPVPHAEYFYGGYFGGKYEIYSRRVTNSKGEDVIKDIGKASTTMHFYAFSKGPRFTFTHATSPPMEPVDITIELHSAPSGSTSSTRFGNELNKTDWTVTVVDQYGNPVSNALVMLGRECEKCWDGEGINLYALLTANEKGKAVLEGGSKTPEGVRIYTFKRGYRYGFKTVPSAPKPVREKVVMKKLKPKPTNKKWIVPAVSFAGTIGSVILLVKGRG